MPITNSRFGSPDFISTDFISIIFAVYRKNRKAGRETGGKTEHTMRPAMTEKPIDIKVDRIYIIGSLGRPCSRLFPAAPAPLPKG
jgi:hypothetical protein